MANSLQILILALLLWLAIEDLATSEQWGISAITGLAFWAILRKHRLLPRKIDQRLQSLLFPLRVRIRAFELRLMRGRATPPADPYIHICQNCGDGYTGNFCNRCGQTSRTGRYHFRQMIRNVIGGFTNIDNGFGRTIVELLYRPGLFDTGLYRRQEGCLLPSLSGPFRAGLSVHHLCTTDRT